MKNWKQLSTLFIALLVSTTLALQIEEIDGLYKKLISDAIENTPDAHHRSGDCYENEDNITLSCFEAGPHWIGDFNKDGEDDILIKFLDEGLGGGGNALGYVYIMLILKDGNAIDKEIIFGGGKFSETHWQSTRYPTVSATEPKLETLTTENLKTQRQFSFVM